MYYVKYLNRPFLVLCFFLALAFIATTNVKAQGDSLTWSEPERAWGYEDDADTPFMVADQNRTVHAMNSRTSPSGADIGGIDITYRRWTRSLGWSEPVDVILSPKKNIARIRGMILDDEGYFHVVFYGGDEQDASIYYTSALASEADRAPAWTEPVSIGDFAGPINDAVFAGDGGDRLFVIYTGHEDGMGAYATSSEDAGLTWSDPEIIHRSALGQWPTHYALYLDKEDNLHAAWSEADSSGNGQILYYTRRASNSASWIPPIVIDEAMGYEVDMPAIVEHGEELLLVYHSNLPTTRTVRKSLDYGRTWSGPDQPFQQIGSDRAVSFVHDSQGTLHMFFGNRVNQGGRVATHGMWHSIYNNGRFSQPTAIVSGPPVGDDGDEPFDPQFAQAVAVQGNVILVAWRQDPARIRSKVWFSYATIDTPALPIVQLPTPVPTAAPVLATETPAPTPVPTVTPFPSSASNDAAVAGSPMTPLLLGAVSVLVMVGLVVAGKAVGRKG